MHCPYAPQNFFSLRKILYNAQLFLKQVHADNCDEIFFEKIKKTHCEQGAKSISIFQWMILQINLQKNKFLYHYSTMI